MFVTGKVLQTGVESKICKMSLMKKFKNLNCNNEAVPRYGTDKVSFFLVARLCVCP